MAAEDSSSETKTETETETKTESKADSKSDVTTSTQLYSRADVAKHNDGKDVWLIIHNKVYDVTAFLGQHPGGEEVLLEQGGQDGTEPFEDIGHSSDARELMEQYYVGELVPEDRVVNETKQNKDWSSEGGDDDSSSGSWRSWLIPIALGVLVTLVYRYFINAH